MTSLPSHVKRNILIPCLLAIFIGSSAFGASTFSGAVQSGFQKWDLDHDGMLSLSEIEWGLASPDIKGEEAAALATIFRGARLKSSPLTPPLSQSDLERFAKKSGAPRGSGGKESDDESTDEHNSDLEASYARALDRIEKTPRILFTNGVPHLETFRQGRIGSCFCLAPLAALIYRDPAEVSHRFSPEAGGFIVRLNDNRRVWVSPPTDGEIAISSTTGTDGIWSTVYEKAVGQMRMEDKGVSGPPWKAATAGSAGTMVGVLTGRSIIRFSCSPWRKADSDTATLAGKLDELRELLRDSVAAHRLVTGGTGTKGVKVPSLSFGHAYAVLGYDSSTDLITIRDPHGQDFKPAGAPGLENGYVVDRGIFTAPLPEVVRFMGGFAFEQPTAATGAPAAEPDPAIGL